jgi:Rad3-related DNA helicase
MKAFLTINLFTHTISVERYFSLLTLESTAVSLALMTRESAYFLLSAYLEPVDMFDYSLGLLFSRPSFHSRKYNSPPSFADQVLPIKLFT